MRVERSEGQLILDILSDRPIAYHPGLAHLLGSVNAAVFLCQLLYWTGRGNDPEGWIWKKQEDWTQETGLSRHEQCGARRILRQKGIVEETQRGFDRTIGYRVRKAALVELIESAGPSPEIGDGSAGNRQSNREKSAIELPEIGDDHAEITPEITPETAPSGSRADHQANAPPLGELRRELPQVLDDLDDKDRNPTAVLVEWIARVSGRSPGRDAYKRVGGMLRNVYGEGPRSAKSWQIPYREACRRAARAAIKARNGNPEGSFVSYLEEILKEELSGESDLDEWEQPSHARDGHDAELDEWET